MTKRKTLPRDFEQLLISASPDELKAVFDKCLLDARGGYSKHTAIGFLDCPDELIVWLVGQGLDVDTADTYDGTPLWERAFMGRERQIPLLLSLGADIHRPRRHAGSPLHGSAASQRPTTTKVLLERGADARALNDARETPLLHGLRRTRNGEIANMAKVAQMLIDAGDSVTEEMRSEVTRIGTEFEFHRSNFNPDLLGETDAGLARLYRLFGVTPAARRQLHDGVSQIIPPEGSWQEQHQALWELLVPSAGAATTAQGEVIRLSGRIAHEILGNGGSNWDHGFKKMLNALVEHFGTGNSLPPDDLQNARHLARALHGGTGDEEQVYRLSELAVAWVASNPAPIPPGKVPYDR